MFKHNEIKVVTLFTIKLSLQYRKHIIFLKKGYILHIYKSIKLNYKFTHIKEVNRILDRT